MAAPIMYPAPVKILAVAKYCTALTIKKIVFAIRKKIV
jgi:hypothetical protein